MHTSAEFEEWMVPHGLPIDVAVCMEAPVKIENRRKVILEKMLAVE